MKKIMQWMLAATLICGTCVITCSNSSDDHPAAEAEDHGEYQWSAFVPKAPDYSDPSHDAVGIISHSSMVLHCIFEIFERVFDSSHDNILVNGRYAADSYKLSVTVNYLLWCLVTMGLQNITACGKRQ